VHGGGAWLGRRHGRSGRDMKTRRRQCITRVACRTAHRRAETTGDATTGDARALCMHKARTLHAPCADTGNAQTTLKLRQA
jgi:hypothetical protein